MLNADSIRNHVASATYASLIRIAGGGYATSDATAPKNPPNNNGNNHHVICGNNSQQQWMEELKKISYSSVSFPNGINNKSAEGKPHDVEVRAALALFHRIQRGRRGHKEEVGKKGAKKLRKRKKVPSNDESESSLMKKEEEDAFEIISDLGTCREIDSIKSLANLLSFELEKELITHSHSKQQTTNNELTNETKSKQQKNNDDSIQPTISPMISFTDIRPSNSGIICLVSNNRSKQLLAAGRIPCTHCTKYFKGTKGLWWHQLRAHGINYSLATELAAGVVNPLAIVPFREPLTMTTEVVVQIIDADADKSHEGSAAPEMDAFDMVKLGKREEFINLVEVSEAIFRPCLFHSLLSLISIIP